MSEEATVRNMSHVVIQASNIQKTIRFYELLGFNVERIISLDFNNPGDINDLDNLPLNHSEVGDFYCVGMGLGKDPRATTRIEIFEWVTPQKKPNYDSATDHLGISRIAFTVKGVDTLIERVKGQGYKVDEKETVDISPALSSVFVHVYDPDGNWLTLMEWIKK